MNKMNIFFGNSVVEKIKFTSFDDEKKNFIYDHDYKRNVTNNKYQSKVKNVKNENAFQEDGIGDLHGNVSSSRSVC